ncbi:hypothetical protein INR49_013667 [Caranx melampygus]|nr:hypothetical protein INR49_013667 [Caranx melampygus]
MKSCEQQQMFGVFTLVLLFAHQLIPLFIFIGGGVTMSATYLARLALKNPDVSWDRKNNPEPWNKLEPNQQYKLTSANQLTNLSLNGSHGGSICSGPAETNPQHRGTQNPHHPQVALLVSQAERSSGTRRSIRLSKKMLESITRKSLPATTRRTTSSVLRKANTPGPASMLFDDGDTPRHILRNIVRTEPVRSPVVHKRPASEGPQLPSANSSITSKRPSTEFSGLDLPDLTIATALSTAKGLSRKRPRRSFNVTAFEKRLKDGNDVEEENDQSISDHSSLSLSSSTSLSLKTPFVDVRTEKKGLQRKVPNRRKITEEEFGAAIDRWQTGSDYVEQGANETTCPDGFTLGLSDLSEPDVTTDIVNCNTALYTHPDATAASFFNVATQDKPTVMASQLQRQIEVEQSKLGKDNSVYVFPTEENMAEPPNEECDLKLQLKKDEDSAECQEEERKRTNDHAESQPCPSHNTSKSEEEQNKLEAQIPEEAPADPHSKGDVASRSQSEESDVVPDSQTEAEEEGGDDDDFQPEEDVAGRSQSEEEEVPPDSQTEAEVEVAAETQTEEEDDAVESQSEEDGEAKSQSEEDRDLAESQDEDHHDGNQEEGEVEQASEQLEYDLEHISRRARCSEGGLIVPVTEAGWSGDKSEGHRATELHSNLETGSPKSSQPQDGMSNLLCLQPMDRKMLLLWRPSLTLRRRTLFINCRCHMILKMAAICTMLHLKELLLKHLLNRRSGRMDVDEDEDDDEESEGQVASEDSSICQRERNFFQQDLQASPVLKTIQVSGTGKASPTAKPKQVQRKRQPAKKEGGLPKNYLMGVFKHFAKTKVSADVYPVLKEIMDKFFDRLANDLETQGYVNDKVPVEVLIEKYLRMEQRKLLIPIATSGNVVIPKKRR